MSPVKSCGPALLLCVSTLGWAGPAGQSPESGESPKAGPELLAAPLPEVTLDPSVFAAGVQEEPEHLVRVAKQIEELSAAARAASEPSVRARLHLSAANLILSRQIEPEVTRLLLGIEQEMDRSRLATYVRDAQVLLDEAAEVLESVAIGVEDDSAPPTPGLRYLHTSLQAFAQALAVAWAESPDAETEDVERPIRTAASGLAVLLEDQRADVAAAARLYQAVLYQRAGRFDRAKRVLPPALKPPPDAATELGFFARLLRCRYLADDGGYVVASSLLLKLEERAYDWFNNDAQREAAGRGAALLRLAVARSWGRSFDETDQEANDRRQWCGRSAQRIVEDYFSTAGRPTVIRLGQAVPLLLEVAPDPS